MVSIAQGVYYAVLAFVGISLVLKATGDSWKASLKFAAIATPSIGVLFLLVWLGTVLF